MPYPDTHFRVDRQLGVAIVIIDQADQAVGTAIIGDDMISGRGPSLGDALRNAELFAAAPALLDELQEACISEMSHNGRLLEFDTWAITATKALISAMEKRLKLIARLRGKSTFGNDWQDALR